MTKAVKTTKVIKASDIKDGMKIYVQGNLMIVSEVNKVVYPDGSGTGTYFKGHVVNEDSHIKNTIYDGGGYGSIDSCEWTIEVE